MFFWICVWCVVRTGKKAEYLSSLLLPLLTIGVCACVCVCAWKFTLLISFVWSLNEKRKEINGKNIACSLVHHESQDQTVSTKETKMGGLWILRQFSTTVTEKKEKKNILIILYRREIWFFRMKRVLNWSEINEKFFRWKWWQRQKKELRMNKKKKRNTTHQFGWKKFQSKEKFVWFHEKWISFNDFSCVNGVYAGRKIQSNSSHKHIFRFSFCFFFFFFLDRSFFWHKNWFPILYDKFLNSRFDFGCLCDCI